MLRNKKTGHLEIRLGFPTELLRSNYRGDASMPYEHMLQSNRIGVLLSTILNQIQWTHVVATLFVTKDLAAKSNLLLKRNDMDPSKV